MRKYIPFLVRTGLLVIVIFAGYYFLILAPQARAREENREIARVLHRQEAFLSQNLVAFSALSELREDEPTFDYQKSYLVATLRQTNSEGRSHAHEVAVYRPELADETVLFYEKQSEVLEEVFATETLTEGLAIMQTDTASSLLSVQQDLAKKYREVITILER